MTDFNDAIRIGSRIRVQGEYGEAEFRLVDPAEAYAIADRVSADSPVGRALLGIMSGT